MTVVAIGRTGAIALVTDTISVGSPLIRALDVDRDRIDEIVGVANDCEPACAGGHLFWVVYKLAGPGYIRVGCAPYANESRPPTALTPAACRY